MIIIKGKHAVAEALKSNIKIHSISIVQHDFSPEIHHIKQEAQHQSIPISLLSKQEAHKKFKLESHQQIIAKLHPIPTHPLSIIHPNKHPIIVALDHLEDPFNVGAILRTCEGLGIAAVILPKNRQAPLDAGVIKASSGAAYHVPLIQVSNIAQTLISLEKKGYWIYSTDSTHGTPLNQFSPALPCVVVMGNEHKGISKRVSKLAHSHIKIEMKGQIQSLNVSVATGIILHYLATSS